MDVINIALALFSIGLGAVGWLAPRYTMEVVDLREGTSTMGLSEIRAASGALFVGLGVGALILGSAAGFVMVGFAWSFAAAGRLTSALLDERPTPKTWGFFATEALVGAILVIGNLPGL